MLTVFEGAARVDDLVLQQDSLLLQLLVHLHLRLVSRLPLVAWQQNARMMSQHKNNMTSLQFYFLLRFPHCASPVHRQSAAVPSETGRRFPFEKES